MSSRFVKIHGVNVPIDGVRVEPRFGGFAVLAGGVGIDEIPIDFFAQEASAKNVKDGLLKLPDGAMAVIEFSTVRQIGGVGATMPIGATKAGVK